MLLLPLIGPEAFSAFSQVAKYVHNYVSFSFVIGLVLIVAMWMKDNIPRQGRHRLVQAGRRLHQVEACARAAASTPARSWCSGSRFGAGVAVAVSGYLLLFPFYVTDIVGMQIAQVVHGIIALLFVALILGHIYIGTLGMEGAFEAMGTGEVDLNWAKEHHDLWLEDQIAKGRVGRHLELSDDASRMSAATASEAHECWA